MSEFRLNPEIKECFVTHIECKDNEIVIWSQTEISEVFNFETLIELNYRQMFYQFFTANRFTIKPIEGKYYVFCDKTKLQFYRVLVRSVVDNQSLVQFIDFGYEELVPNDCLFIYPKMFINCKSLAQKFILSDIRPKNPIKGFNSEKVVKSLQKFVKSVLVFVINDENKVQVFNRNGEQIIKRVLQTFEDIIIETNDLNAIEFGDNSSEELTNNLIDLSDKSDVTSEDSLDTIVSGLKTQNDSKLDKESIESHLKTLIGSKHWVYISKAFSGKSLFVHLREESLLLEELNQKLQDIYKNAIREDLYALKDTSKDCVIAVQYSADNNWYRARVVDVKGTQLKVFYIDFGNSEVIELKSCRQLLPELSSLSPLAVRCLALNENLGSDVLEMFEIQEYEIECHFQTLMDDRQTMEVLLYENGVLIGPEENQEKTNCPEKTKEELWTQDLMRRSEEFWLSLLTTTESVIISRAENSQSLNCYLLESKKTLEPLVQQMKRFYQKEIRALDLDELKQVMQRQTLIAVYYDLEDKWLRARVQQAVKEEIKVLFVDFGITESVKPSDCRLLAEEFFETQVLSFKCCPNNKSLKYYELKKLESNETPLKLRFIDRKPENVFIVEIV